MNKQILMTTKSKQANENFKKNIILPLQLTNNNEEEKNAYILM